ncbi:MAG: hypothetical protein LJE84_12015, partial [Gammaproteobacteria bacterium]|nr:hypothetical protein [Gammaproteobacteria bacterium]
FSLSVAAQGDTWLVKKTSWSQADEQSYQQFIRALGSVAFEKKCDTPDGACKGIGDLVGSEGNPYRGKDPQWVKLLHTDCADFPLTLRAYFAWKNSLPHAVANGVAPVGYCGVVSDTRFCKNGNKVVSRRAVQTGTSAKEVLGRWSVSPTTSIYRTHYLDEHGLGSDFYSPALDRSGITPGTIIYNPNGHTSLVFDVLEDGRVRYVETSIDGTIHTGLVTSAKIPIKPDSQGWGFKKWKPVTVVGARRNADGYYVGGKTVVPRATQVPGYSPFQYTGRVEGTDNSYRFNGQLVSYHELLRQRLAKGTLRIDPVVEIRNLVDAACLGIQDRVQAVHQAVRVGMHEDPHPNRLPPNIYGTGGHWQWYHWESYSTPSKDAHIKTELKNILDVSRDLVQSYRDKDPRITYRGKNIASDMLNAYVAAARRCRVSYTNSNGQSVPLDLLNITERAFRLSFDPYHCIELRWGAQGEELNSCKTGSAKMLWYKNEQFLRNQIDRRYDDRMDFTVEELASLRPGNGVAEPPDINVLRYLQSQR